MRIIAGKYKKTPLKTIESDSTRPTKDMVKEALFDSIQIMPDEKLLDLFAGSGAIGIEAISRGAKAEFNDLNREAIKVIEANLDKIHEEAKVLNLNYDECLAKQKDGKFDYLFVDPPYAFEQYDNIFVLANKYNVMNDKGLIILEVKADRSFKEEYEDYKLFKEKKYGICKLLYYRRSKQ